jgi:hypothetical protein
MVRPFSLSFSSRQTGGDLSAMLSHAALTRHEPQVPLLPTSPKGELQFSNTVVGAPVRYIRTTFVSLVSFLFRNTFLNASSEAVSARKGANAVEKTVGHC